MSTAWVHPLTRAANILIGRLRRLERTMPATEEALATWEGWKDYVETSDALARCIQVTRGATWGEASGEPPTPPRRKAG